MKYKSVKFFTILLTVFLLACTGPAPAPDPGMEVIHYDRNEVIQLANGVDLRAYNKIVLEPVTVEFRENWKRDLERRQRINIRDRDIERITTDATELFDKVISRELTERHGYEVTSTSGDGVMRWTPRIHNLDIIAPDRVHDNIVESLVDSQGSMTIELEIHDSVSGRLLATASQWQEDPYKGYMERTTSATNAQAFRLMMHRWSDWLFKHFEESGAGASDSK